MSRADESMSGDGAVEAPTRGRRILRWLSALVLLSLLFGGGYRLMLWEPRHLPVRVVTVDGKLKHLSPRRLQDAVIGHLSGGILTQDLAELKAAVEAMPWVRSASLRRHWPDRLELAVVEQVPFARWGDEALVTADGVVFRPGDGDLPQGLSKLSGREEQAPLLVKRLQRWEERLESLDLSIEALTVDARGAWTLRLRAGFDLALGATRVLERISRFARVYPQVIAVGMPSLVDMRYSNGLAIRWADPTDEGSGPDNGKAARSAQLKSRPSGPSRS